jgi:RimJ/RimL family protein N-acetyltransferase
MELISTTIQFRPAQVADAEFIHSLRTNETYSRYISKVDDDINKQKEWLLKYKEREALGLEYYFIIQRNSDLLPIGTVRIYDFIKEEKSFCWGSWILTENKTHYAALECALLIYDFAFFELGYKRCHMDIRKQNAKAIEFHRKFGVRIVDESDIDLFGHLYLEDYLKVRDDFRKIING